MKFREQVLIVVLILFKVNPIYGDVFTLSDLLVDFGRVEHLKVAFTETRRFLFLDLSVLSKGTMEYKNTGFLEKITTSPVLEKVTIDGDNIHIEKTIVVGKNKNNIKTQVFSVNSYPNIQLAVEDTYSFLKGDLKTLEEKYSFELEGTNKQWRLKIFPTVDAVRDIFNFIDITGQGVTFSSVFIDKVEKENVLIQFEHQTLELKQ